MGKSPLVLTFGNLLEASQIDGSGGDGYGSGGDGSGPGSGYGYGFGSGYGNGSGYGSGYGYGFGSGFWRLVASAALCKVSIPADATFVGFWRSDVHGRASNGGDKTESVRVGTRQKINGPLEICTPKGLHCTTNPDKWKGERLWIVALFGEVQRKEDKAAALEREILCEVKV